MDETEKKRGEKDLREVVGRYLNDLRVRYGLPECSYQVPFDGPEKRGRPDYLPFVWADPVARIFEAASEYVREKKERRTFAEDRRQHDPKTELADLARDNRNIIEKLKRLSVAAQAALNEAGFDMAQYLTLNNALFQVDWAKLEKPGRGRQKEPEKERLLDELVEILRVHLGRIPTDDDVEDLCEKLFGERLSAEKAVRRAFNVPWPSEVLVWFRKKGLDLDSIPEGTYRWTRFAEACADLYDRPERLRKGAKPMTFEAKKKLYRAILNG